MFIIADKRIPPDAKERLAKYGELIEFETSGITEEAISGHPDIFISLIDGKVIMAPNIPEIYSEMLMKSSLECIKGKGNITEDYPGCAAYNAVINDDLLVHRLDVTDPVILDLSKGRSQIDVMQGFSRCSLLPLKDNHFITSDEGIYKSLLSENIRGIYVNPLEIVLPGHKHGFFGGCCGIYGDSVFVTGGLGHFTDGKKVLDYFNLLNYNIIELYSGPLFDGGGILFID